MVQSYIHKGILYVSGNIAYSIHFVVSLPNILISLLSLWGVEVSGLLLGPLLGLLALRGPYIYIYIYIYICIYIYKYKLGFRRFRKNGEDIIICNLLTIFKDDGTITTIILNNFKKNGKYICLREKVCI